MPFNMMIGYNGAFSIASKSDIDDQNLLLATVHTYTYILVANKCQFSTSLFTMDKLPFRGTIRNRKRRSQFSRDLR
jgi:hypothetical protein